MADFCHQVTFNASSVAGGSLLNFQMVRVMGLYFVLPAVKLNVAAIASFSVGLFKVRNAVGYRVAIGLAIRHRLQPSSPAIILR